MTRHKDFKRLVRARMSKTGESYTTARTQVLAQPSASRTRPGAVRVGPVVTQTAASVPDLPALAGMKDETLKERTGCTWERWVHALDHHGAAQMSHGDIVRVIREKYHIDSWWAQTVTVGYERIKGLRARGQRRNGSFEANKSRTFNVPPARLFEAWSNARLRRRWLGDAAGRVRTQQPSRSIRLDGPDASIIAVGFYPKGPSKCLLAVQHMKLRDRETADRLKAEWSGRLDALAALLAP